MSRNISRLMTVFMIHLIILLPMAVAQTTGEPAATTIPINAEIPEYVNSERISITGTTDPGTKLYLYVNGVKQRKFDPEETGRFSFNNVELSIFKVPNVLTIEAVKDDITSQKHFQVIVDTTIPAISIEPIPAASAASEITVKGTVSETAVIDIILNNNTIHTFEADSFDKKIVLDEGANELKIITTDKAGNTDIKQGTILMDTTPPDIENLIPKSGSFFYETDPITDIEGDTEPYSKVYLYIGKKPDGKADEETTADAKGHFKFEDVNLEGGYALAGRAGYIGFSSGTEDDPGKEHLPSKPEDIEERAEIAEERKQDEVLVDIYVLAEDPVGLKSQERMSYTIGTCFAGGMAWNVNNLIEYQSPNMLSPERLAEGTEIATFILNLSYHGFGTKPSIKDVKFERACKATAAQDDRYKYGCQVLPSTPSIRKGNDAMTTWYIKYNLNKLEGMDNFTEDVWKDLTKQFVLPLKVRVDYSHEVDGKETPDYQTKCFNLAYHVDTSRIDPGDVLPDWLLTDGMDFINESITQLNDIIPTVEKIMRYAAIACIIGFGLKVITRSEERRVGKECRSRWSPYH